MTREQLTALEQELSTKFEQYKKAGLNLDLTRGKPAGQQLDLSNGLDGLLQGNYKSGDGTDTRNYGGLDGLPEMKALAGQMMGVKPAEVVIGGNSSLTLMYQFMMHAHFWGPLGKGSAWNEGSVRPKFICNVPGYDRHFTICEDLGIEMISVELKDDGPDMDAIEKLVRNDPSIKGMWCVPKHSNPTGHIYSDAVVERIAKLAKIAGSAFVVMWDNAYAVHDFGDNVPELANLMEHARKNGTENSIVITASTSKITFAGAGISFLGASEEILKHFKKRLTAITIGPDKVNQLRHLRMIKDMNDVTALMKQHAAILKPKFEMVLKILEQELGGKGIATWTIPTGGYFVSFDIPGLAKEVVKLSAEAGVKLTPAGSTYPYMKDPQDKNIRIAPSFPSLKEIEPAMNVFVTCVQLAHVRNLLVKNQ
ncbi:MAG: aminotransferase class I/II-fold pyridoxal phosphate-dependent enzyme [SAR324 cluster bacterium]|nr:aminotransferase class I/II-fold pyridoxal phosphate-dependent enzyme [SAR324 cluster bacterium]